MKTYNMNNDKKDNKELSPDDLKKHPVVFSVK